MTNEAGAATAHAVAALGVTKRFPGIVANDDVTFEVRRGEVHALLGENGAGKTTLSNVLTGLYRPDEGSVVVDGRAVTLYNDDVAYDDPAAYDLPGPRHRLVFGDAGWNDAGWAYVRDPNG